MFDFLNAKTLSEHRVTLGAMLTMPEIYANRIPEDEYGPNAIHAFEYVMEWADKADEFLLNFTGDQKVPAYSYAILAWQFLGVLDVYNRTISLFTDGKVQNVQEGIVLIFGDDSDEVLIAERAIGMAVAMKDIVNQTKDANLLVSLKQD